MTDHTESLGGRAGASFYLGVFLLTFATLLVEVLQTRLLSVVTWYHLAFFVISSAMFGMTAGAVWVYLRKDRYGRESLSHDLSWMALCFGLTTALGLAFQSTLAPAAVGSLAMLLVYAEVSLAIATPFFFSGAAVSLALTRSPYPVGKVYAADLAGAALGCLAVLIVLDRMDAPSAILLAGAVGTTSAIFFQSARIGGVPARAGWTTRIVRAREWIALALVVLALANAASTHGIQPIVVKERVEKRGREVTYEHWNSFSRVVALAPRTSAPDLWGPSTQLPESIRAEQLTLNIDGGAQTVMVRFDGNPEHVRFLSYDVTTLAYFIRNQGQGAVIGVGSGRDLLSAWSFGMRDVTGVEINPTFIGLLTRREPYRTFAGLSSLDGVHLIVDEARSWFSRTPQRYDVIQMSMIDTWAATGAGAFTLTENGLYTLESWKMFLSRLRERGVFTVSRWYAPGEVNETGRMISLATAALLASGSQEPREHLFLASSDKVATLILCRSPLSASDLETLRRVCRERDYRVLLDPGGEPASPVLADIVSASDPGQLRERTSGFELDLTPPTDERPFFFNILPLNRPLLLRKYFRHGGVIGGNLTATGTLLVLLFVSILLVIATIVVPLAPSKREVGRRLVAGGTLYFGFLGLGFMFVEMGLLQRLSVFLGHPIYSLSIVLFSLILTLGLGSWLSERVRRVRPGAFTLRATLTALYVGLLPWWMPHLLAVVETQSLMVRALTAIGVIAPAGILMGFGFPLGMRLVQGHDSRPTPWFWGVNGAAGVTASVIAVALSIAFGISTTLVLGALCYLGLIPAARQIGFQMS
jgi:hypothetical protein